MDTVAPGLLSTETQIALADHVFDLGRDLLLDAQGGAVELRPQAHQVLRVLALAAGRVVTKDELMQAVWPGLVVTDDSLVQAVGDIRRALGPAGRDVIRTVPRRGYVLNATPVLPAPSSSTSPSSESPVPARRTKPLWLAVGAALAAVLAAWLMNRAFVPDDGVQAEADLPSVAVLAFKDPQGDAPAQLLARGLAEDLVAELSRAQGWRVVSHQSSFQLDAATTPLAQIGRQLRSRYLVSGTVRREGDRLRVVVDLIDSRDGHLLWSSPQVLSLGDIAPAQQALVSRIAGSLQTRVRLSEERLALSRSPANASGNTPGSLDVYLLTQHGKSQMQRYNPQGIREARRLLEQAVASDPAYAPAWVYLGMTNTIDAGLRLSGEWHPGRMSEVLAPIERAVALSPDLPIAYVALSQAQALARDFDGALISAERCMALSPNDADCFYILGKAQLALGRADAAVRNLQQALDRNPMPPAYLPAFHATALWANGRFEETLRTTDECLLKAPEFWRCRQDRLAALVALGRVADARLEADRLKAQVPRMTAEAFGLVFADSAAAIGERRVAAARAAGFP